MFIEERDYDNLQQSEFDRELDFLNMFELPIEGVYVITNNINGWQYVGLSKNIKRRFKEHKASITNKKLNEDINLFGLDNFSFDVLYIGDNVLIVELYFMVLYSTMTHLYNTKASALINCNRNNISFEEFKDILPDGAMLKFDKKNMKGWHIE